jgi:hypothetical protein
MQPNKADKASSKRATYPPPHHTYEELGVKLLSTNPSKIFLYGGERKPPYMVALMSPYTLICHFYDINHFQAM